MQGDRPMDVRLQGRASPRGLRVNPIGIPAHGRDYTDEEIRSFVDDLESLPSGDLTVSLLVGCGARAIGPLRDYLLRGRPRGIFQPRQRAVEALAQLGAKDVLIEYLSQKKDIRDAEVRFGEEAVQNTAARSLSEWLTGDVFDLLADLADERQLTGVIETLGKFERPEAGPIFVRALGDDVCHPVAYEALQKIAGRVKALLFAAAKRANPNYEKPSERQRRQSVVRILAELDLVSEDWEKLRPLLEDEDATVARTVAQIALDRAPQEEREEATRFLIRSLTAAPWFEQMRIQECLARNYAAVERVIEEETARRQKIVSGPQLADAVLRILDKLRRAHEQKSKKEMLGHGE
jgi:hypothetical protein